MRNWLGPLLVFLVFGGIALRVVDAPSVDVLRDRVTKEMRMANPEGARAAVNNYLARRDNETSRNFAADVLFRLGSWREALALKSKDAQLHTDAATSRNVARQALAALAWNDLERKDPSPLEPEVICTLAQGGDAWAESRLSDIARNAEFTRVFPFFMRSFDGFAPRAVAILRCGAQPRTEETAEIAVAVASALDISSPMPPDDADVLVETITGDTWRERSPFIWYYAALAFGLTGDARTDEVTDAALRKMPDGPDPHLDPDRARLRLAKHQRGWLKTTDGEQWRSAEKPDLPSAEWIARYVCRDVLRGDAEAKEQYADLWRQPGQDVELLRLRLAGPYLLAAKKDTGLPDENMLRDLDGLSKEAQIYAQAWRLRRGDPAARKTLWTWVESWGSQEIDVNQESVEAKRLLGALRALYLYDDMPSN